MLKSRLNNIYKLIDKCDCVVDVGSDHAFLSIELLKNKKCNFTYNIEINQKPLENGLKNIENNNLLNKNKSILNDGFKNIKLDKNIDYVCISGMGATSIIDIIENNKNNIPSYYIVQANADIWKLKLFILENNFEMLNEEIVTENNLYYEVIKFSTKQQKIIFNNNDIYIGKLLKNKQDKILKQYLLFRYNHLKKLPISLVNENIKSEFYTIENFLNEKKWIN